MPATVLLELLSLVTINTTNWSKNSC